MRNFYIDGVPSSTYGIYISGTGVWNAPERDVEVIEIPGRNGTLTLDNGRYKNIEVRYPAIFVNGFQSNIEGARAWLCKSPGYRRLEDDHDLTHYRLARYVSGLELNVATMLDAAKTTLRFDCMPQRFLKSGETEVTVTTDITNPTLFDALPKITVTGSSAGSLTINGNTVTISEIGTSVVLDCEIQRAYHGTTPRDNSISGSFPVLVPGVNTISYSGGVTSVKIVPRWWTL